MAKEVVVTLRLKAEADIDAAIAKLTAMKSKAEEPIKITYTDVPGAPSTKSYVSAYNLSDQSGLASGEVSNAAPRPKSVPTNQEAQEAYLPESSEQAAAIERTVSALQAKEAVLNAVVAAQGRSDDEKVLAQQDAEAQALGKTQDRIESLTKSLDAYYNLRSIDGKDIDDKEAQSMEKTAESLKKRIEAQEKMMDAQRETHDPNIQAQRDKEAQDLFKMEDAYKAITERLKEFNDAKGVKQYDKPIGPPLPEPPKEHVGILDQIIHKVRELQEASHAAGGGLAGLLQVLKNIGTSAAGIATEALGSLIGVARHGVEAFEHLEVAVTDLNSKLAAAGRYNEEYSESLQHLSERLEESTNIAKTQWLDVLGKLTQFGAKPDNIEQYAKAVENLAGLMGGNLESAGFIFARVLEGNYYSLRRYGIEIDHAKSRTQILSDVMQQLEQKGAGVLENRTKTITGEFTKFRLELHETWEGIGNLISRTGILQTTLEALHFTTRALNAIFPQTVEAVDGMANKIDVLRDASKVASTRMTDLELAAAGVSTAVSKLGIDSGKLVSDVGKVSEVISGAFNNEKTKIDEVNKALKDQLAAMYKIEEARIKTQAKAEQWSPEKTEAALAQAKLNFGQQTNEAELKRIEAQQANIAAKEKEHAERVSRAKEIAESGKKEKEQAAIAMQEVGLGGIRQMGDKDWQDQLNQLIAKKSEAESHLKDIQRTMFQAPGGIPSPGLESVKNTLTEEVEKADKQIEVFNKYGKAATQWHKEQADLKTATDSQKTFAYAVMPQQMELKNQAVAAHAEQIKLKYEAIENDLEKRRKMAQEESAERTERRNQQIGRIKELKPQTIAQAAYLEEQAAKLERENVQDKINAATTDKERLKLHGDLHKIEVGLVEQGIKDLQNNELSTNAALGVDYNLLKTEQERHDYLFRKRRELGMNVPQSLKDRVTAIGTTELPGETAPVTFPPKQKLPPELQRTPRGEYIQPPVTAQDEAIARLRYEQAKKDREEDAKSLETKQGLIKETEESIERLAGKEKKKAEDNLALMKKEIDALKERIANEDRAIPMLEARKKFTEAGMVNTPTGPRSINDVSLSNAQYGAAGAGNTFGFGASDPVKPYTREELESILKRNEKATEDLNAKAQRGGWSYPANLRAADEKQLKRLHDIHTNIQEQYDRTPAAKPSPKAGTDALAEGLSEYHAKVMTGFDLVLAKLKKQTEQLEKQQGQIKNGRS